MNEEKYTFVVPGDPTPWARCRFNRGRFYDSQKNAKLALGIHIQNQLATYPNIFPFAKQPLGLDITFYFRIPASAKGKDHRQENYYHYYKPDADNCLKFIKDALTSILYEDDCLIAYTNHAKRYSKDPRIEFTIFPLGEQ